MAVSYKDLGLVNTRDMFAKAMAGKYAIPAFNFNNMEQLQAIIQACVETQSPVIFRFPKAPVTMPTRLCCVIWLRVLLNMPRNFPAARVFRSFCTWTTVRILKPAKAASTSVSAPL